MADRAKPFFTETASMRTLTFPTSSQVDWGFRGGLALVALFAAAEIFGVSYHYLGRVRLTRHAAEPAVVATAPTAAPFAPATAAPSAAAATTPAAPTTALTTPAPTTQAPADRLLQEAKAF